MAEVCHGLGLRSKGGHLLPDHRRQFKVSQVENNVKALELGTHRRTKSKTLDGTVQAAGCH